MKNLIIAVIIALLCIGCKSSTSSKTEVTITDSTSVDSVKVDSTVVSADTTVTDSTK
jgi:uncharacterized protein YcfL